METLIEPGVGKVKIQFEGGFVRLAQLISIIKKICEELQIKMKIIK